VPPVPGAAESISGAVVPEAACPISGAGPVCEVVCIGCGLPLAGGPLWQQVCGAGPRQQLSGGYS